MHERLLTPSKITAWLECGHFLTLRNQADQGEFEISFAPKGSLAELLIQKGSSYERDCLVDLENQGRKVYQVPGRNPDETFEEWVQRIGNPLLSGHDVIYQMPFVHEGIRGIADFLIRTNEPSEEFNSYEPVDAKLARSQGKPGHVLQLCFYAEALEALTGKAPKQVHLWLGSGDVETLTVEQFRPYWRRLRRQLGELLNKDENSATAPVPCDHCEYCEFKGQCEQQWRSEDSLVYVANIRAPERAALEKAGVRSLVELSQRKAPVDAMHDENLDRLVRQASLQVESRESPDDPPVFDLVEITDDPVFGHGFSLLPEPDDGDVFFDFEGHPFWTPQHDLFFLSGLYLRDANGEWMYDDRWAHDLAEQHEMVINLVKFFAQRREMYPAMHVYHYNHTERSSLERLTRGTESEALFASLVESGFFVDLYVIVKNAVLVGTESYGLKHLERLANFERKGGIEQGAGAVVEYENYMKTKDWSYLHAIATYNEDDVVATKALRDWLVDHRPFDLAWRESVLESLEIELNTDELVSELGKFDPSSPEHLLGDLLNYWRRERSASVTPKFVEARSEFATLYANPDFIANVTFVGFLEGVSRGEPVRDAIFTWPPQEVGPKFASQSRVLFTAVGVEQGYGYLPFVDVENRELRMRWREQHDEMGALPLVFVVDDYIAPGDKPGVLFHLGEQIIAPSQEDPVSRVSMALLAREAPRFQSDRGPRQGFFRDDLDDILSWVGDLDESYVAIQGPPGTGKTYSGSHIIHSLVMSGKRVGITAMSHTAIDNLLEATYRVFEEKGDLSSLRTLRRGLKPKSGALDGVRYTNSASAFESNDFNLVAGTTWLWARAGMRAFPVDVLVVDEAGQLALADAIACANGARSLVMLGDPLQLSQVSQAEHPGGSGASILQHVLGDHATVPNDAGVFISVTRRMHPSICSFISRQIYEGRLTSHESCAQQTTQFGTGLRWLHVAHEGCSTESMPEAQVVADQIRGMMSTPWINQDGEEQLLRGEDFMVVAPYNDQVNLISTLFSRDRELSSVQVGTVDKFQGREAPVVFFTMTTSTPDDMPRGPEFLFSRNRLNVAISRARCLAYLVCTEELLNARAKTIEEMRLIGTLSAFVESARNPSADY